MIFVNRGRVPEPAYTHTQVVQDAKERLLGTLQRSDRLFMQLRNPFDKRIYLQARDDLQGLFSQKCAYCESIIPFGTGNVDHFRPKAVAAERSARDHLHYAWLAYDWDNLVLACDACTIAKRNRFPVQDRRAPMRANVPECRKTERGTMLDPCYDDPTDHLGYDESGKIAGLSKRGALTIKLLDLNRDDLVDGRKRLFLQIYEAAETLKHFERFRGEEIVHPINVGTAESDTKRKIQHLLAADAQFAGAGRTYFAACRSVLDLSIEVSYSGDAVRFIEHVDPIRPQSFDADDSDSGSSIADDGPEEGGDLDLDPARYTGRKALPPLARGRLSRIQVMDFKALDSLDIVIPDATRGAERRASALMLLGDNSTGKSSLLEAITLALLGARNARSLGLDGTTLLRRDANWNRTERPASVALFFDGASTPQVTLDVQVDGTISGTEEPSVVVLAYGPRRYFSDGSRARRYGNSAARVRTLFDSAVVLPDPVPWLSNCSQRDFEAAVRALRPLVLMPETGVVTRGVVFETGRPELSLDVDGRRTPLGRLSEGYRTVVATAVDVFREMLAYWPDLEEAHGIVLIDELETHLHPRWKMRLMRGLREAMPNVQFIATTHDPLCLRGMLEHEVQVLRRRHEEIGGGIELLSDLPNVEALSVEQLLTSEFFGLFSTEDVDTERSLARYTELASLQTPTKEESLELERFRAEVDKRLVLGDSPQSRLMTEVANRFVMEQREGHGSNSGEARDAVTAKILEIWRRPEGGSVES